MNHFFQIYAPTTLAPARDFWTLRYTTTLDNGSLVVSNPSHLSELVLATWPLLYLVLAFPV